VLAALRTKLFGNGRDASKSSAKSRLHFVLVQDRAGLTNEELSRFKEEMVDVIERYFVVKKEGFDISYERKGETTTMLINSPIIVRKQGTVPTVKMNGSKHNASRKKRKESTASQQPAIEGQV